MAQIADILVLVPKLTPIEARMSILASWTDDEPRSASSLWLGGHVVGPFCEYATTLSSRIPLQPIKAEAGNRVRAAAIILEPCFWEPEHPFCYEIQLELHGEAGLLDMRRIIAGIRHLEVDGSELLLNGQPFFVQGVKHFASSSIRELEAWHDAQCDAFLTGSATGLCDRTDRWGPALLHLLVPVEADARDQVTRLRNHPSILMWVLPPAVSGDYFEAVIDSIRKLDRSRPIGRLMNMNEAAIDARSADVLFLPAGHSEIAASKPTKPYIVVGPAPVDGGCTPDTFADRLAELRDTIGSPAGLVGVML